MTTSVQGTTRRRGFAAAVTVAVAVAVTSVWPTMASAAPTHTTPTDVGAVTRLATPLATAINDGYNGYVWVTSGKVDFRASASPSAAVRATAYNESRILATGNQRGGWREFQVRGVVGWAPASHFSHSEPAYNPIRVTVTRTTLHLRFFPGASSQVEITARKSDRAIFTGVQRGGWWELKIGNVYSWAPSNAVSVNGFYSPTKAISVGKSQVGYREPSWRNNKYNTWIRSNQAWCSVFVSWVYDQAGYPAGVPKRASFSAYYSDLRNAGVLDYSPEASELKKGDVVLFDWGRSGGPSHTGIVDRVSGSTIWVVEGNTTDGTGNSERGVFYRQRGIVSVHSWYRPSEYALATR